MNREILDLLINQGVRQIDFLSYQIVKVVLEGRITCPFTVKDMIKALQEDYLLSSVHAALKRLVAKGILVDGTRRKRSFTYEMGGRLLQLLALKKPEGGDAPNQ